MKLKGTALPIVMIFSILIGSLLSLEVLKTELLIKEIDIIRERKNLNDLIRLRQQQILKEDVIETGRKELADGKEITTETMKWGMLDLVKLTARSGKKRENSVFIISYLHDTSLIRINSLEKSIELSDSAAITGHEAYSGELQNLFSNDSKAYYPLLRRQELEIIQAEKPLFPKGTVNALETIKKSDTISRSFFEEVLVIHSKGDIHLENITINGHIYIRSEQMITIDSSAQIDGAILSARNLRIHERVKLFGQLYADETMVIGKQAEIRFPSVLGLMSKGKDDLKNLSNRSQFIPFIRFEKGSKLSGTVFYSKSKPDDIPPILFLEPGSGILGEVHFDGTGYIEGKIFGAVALTGLGTESNGNIESGKMKRGQIRGFKKRNGFSLVLKNNHRFIAKYLS